MRRALTAIFSLLAVALSGGCGDPEQGGGAPVKDSTSARFGDAIGDVLADSGGEDADSASDGANRGAEDSAAKDLPDVADSDLATALPLRQRDCKSHFAFAPAASAKKVIVAGSWDWKALDPMVLQGDVWRLEATLPPGLHCYKLIVDGVWQFDPAVAYRAWCDGVENSGVRVPDCELPLLTLDGPVKATDDGIAARALLWRGSKGAGPGLVKAELLHDFQVTEIADAWDAADGAVNVEVSGLKAGKYTVRISATDADGAVAESILLPFWVEAQAFSWRDALIYLAMIDRFADGDPKNNVKDIAGVDPGTQWHGGDLAGITAAIEAGWFDKLGVRALWLTPWAQGPTGAVGKAPHQVTGYHGYWPIMARIIDDRFGGPAELEALVKAAHGRGIRVLMDLVINHVHAEHEYVKAHPTWFRTGCLCGTKGCDWTDKALECLFASYMPDIDWTQNDASEQFIADALWWQERFDLDGARTDAVKHVERSATANLVARFGERFEAAGTDYFLTGETAMGWSGDDLTANEVQYATINKYLGPHGLDGQFDFVLYHAVVNQVFATSAKGLVHLDVWTGHSQKQYLDGAIMTPFAGSHDTARLISRADYRGQAGHPSEVALNKWADQTLPVAPDEDEPYERARLAMCWLLTTPGAPMLYMGDEYGEFGGRDPDNRHMWRPEGQLAPREVALLGAVRSLGLARQAQPGLRRGAYQSLGASENLLAFLRAGPGLASVLVLLNSGDKSVTESVDVTALGLKPGNHANVLGLGGSLLVGPAGAKASLPARSCAAFAGQKPDAP